MSKIPATGPQNRLLKGDVLAYIGAIPTDYVVKLSSDIEKNSHLDLSNIVLASPSPPSAVAEVLPSAPESTPIAAESVSSEKTLDLPISLAPLLALQSRIEEKTTVAIPLSTLLSRATGIANESLPISKGYFSKVSSDVLFDGILGLPSKTDKFFTRGSYVPNITTPTSYPKPVKGTDKEDIIDILSGQVSRRNSISHSGRSTAKEHEDLNVFSITIPTQDNLRGVTFLEKIKEIVEQNPESLVF